MALAAWKTDRFGPVIREILGSGDRLPQLAPNKGEAGIRSRLQALDSETAVGGARIASKAEARCLMAGLYLYFDWLEPAHLIAQEIQGSTGAFWHGIMHRREPDDGNSGYWFRRVGNHPALGQLGPLAGHHLEEAGEQALREELISGSSWDPFVFIQVCSKARRKGSSERVQILNELQLLEWRTLFEYCFVKGFR